MTRYNENKYIEKYSIRKSNQNFLSLPYNKYREEMDFG